MKIIVRIRRGEKGLTLYVDHRLEDEDTPQVHAYGMKLEKALMGTTENQTEAKP